MNIDSLRRMRTNSFAKITTAIDKINNQSQSYVDDRVWKLEADKAGNATATIRFLPATIKVVNGEEIMDDLPWVKIYSHGFQFENGRWFIDNCPTTIGEPCPVCAINKAHWDSADEDRKKIASARKRKTRYYANVLIIADPKNPENEGQVKIFSFGKKIFDKIMDKMNPTFEDETPINVFDFWEGADFKLRQRKVEGYPNFDQSVFMEPSSVGSDDFILKIANSQYLLQDYIDPKNFKSGDDLKKKLFDLEGKDLPFESTPVERVTQQRIVTKTPETTNTNTGNIFGNNDDAGDEDDDTLAFFKRIAEE